MDPFPSPDYLSAQLALLVNAEPGPRLGVSGGTLEFLGSVKFFFPPFHWVGI